MAEDKTATAQGSSQSRSAAAENQPEEFTHYVHLADGRVQRVDLSAHDAVPLGNAYEEGEGDSLTRTQIIGVYSR